MGCPGNPPNRRNTPFLAVKNNAQGRRRLVHQARPGFVMRHTTTRCTCARIRTHPG